MARVEHDIGRDEAPPVAGDLGALTGQAYDVRAHPDPDPSPDERRRHGVVDIEHPHEGILAGARLEVEVGVGNGIGQPRQEPLFHEMAVAHAGADPADMPPPIRDVEGPAVMLGLEVLQGCERAQRQEARLGIADGPLDAALGGRACRAQDDGLGVQRAEQPDHLVVEPRPRASAGCDHGCVVVEDELLGHATKANETGE
jgi:hypothetical protein